MKLLPLFALTLLSTATLRAGETQLFNGRDLTGWEGNMKLWSVENGAITGKTGAEGDTKLKHNTFLVWRGGKVGDFELKFRYRIEKGNSGVQYRSTELPAGEFGPIISGYQADFEAGQKYSGILYEEKGRGILAERGQKTVVSSVEKSAGDPKSKDFKVEVTGELGKSADIQAGIKSEDWNEYKIVAQGGHVQHFINGRQTIDVKDNDAAHAPKEGVLALQIHVGPPMVVQFKDLVLTTGK